MNKWNKFYLVLSEISWPPPHELFLSSNLSWIETLISQYELSGIQSIQQEVDDKMIKWHSKDIIDKILADWESKPWLLQRLSILRDAIDAHNKGMYSLSVPTLIPQIEGIISKNFRIKGRMGSKSYIKHFQSLLHDAIIITNRNKVLLGFVTDSLLVNFEHGSDKISPLSRHAILHGADIHYATRKNSLKVILLINALNRLFRFESLVNSKIIHLYGCSLIKNSKKERIFYSKFIEAKRNGLDICEKCEKRTSLQSLLW
jgi:hypothetical protein